MRVFIAVPLPVDLKAKLVALQQEFRQLAVGATWVREAGFHITLKFLGEVDSAQIAPIFSCMTETVQRYYPFSLILSGVGVFPRESSPRVLWVGIQDATGSLKQMQQLLEAQLVRAGYPRDDRPFAPHLTLARLKHVSRRNEFFAGLNAQSKAVLGQLKVDHIELVKSQLSPSGARYSIVNAAWFPGAIDTSEDG